MKIRKFRYIITAFLICFLMLVSGIQYDIFDVDKQSLEIKSSVCCILNPPR